MLACIHSTAIPLEETKDTSAVGSLTDWQDGRVSKLEVEKNSLKANQPVKYTSSRKICQELLSSQRCAQLNDGLIPL